MLNQANIDQLGDELFEALRTRRTLVPLTDREPAIEIDDAYHVSQRMLSQRLAENEHMVGKKIGVTSDAVQNMLGVHQPDFGFLTDVMQVPEGSAVSLAEHNLIQPRVEGEIAFVLNRELSGPGVTEDDVLAATAYVTPCFEIVDSRISEWQIRIQDTVADNASCGVFVLGHERIDPNRLDLAAVAMTIHRDGEHAADGLGSAVQGHPATAIAWLANTLGGYDIPLGAGEIILSGSLAPLLPVTAGERYALDLAGVGTAGISFTE